jgi:alpha-L-fucosidase
MKHTLTLLTALLLAWASALPAQVSAPLPPPPPIPPPEHPQVPIPDKIETTPGPFGSTVESLRQFRCPEWFRDAKFGIWSDWCAQSVPMHHNGWYAREMYLQGREAYQYHLTHYGHPSVFGYKDIIQLWKAEQFDPDQLVALFKAAGARYFVAMANFHDNFDLWDSRYHEWNSVNYGPKKNILARWREAALRAGLRFGFTSHSERTSSWFQTAKGADATGPYAGVPYDGNDPKFVNLYMPMTPHWDPKNLDSDTNPPVWWRREWLARINDAVNRYHPDLMYVDGPIPFAGEDQGRTGLSMIANLYNRSVRDHGGKNEAVMCVKRHLLEHGFWWDGIVTRDLERTRMTAINPEPWQTDTSTGPWYYDLTWTNKESGTMYYTPRKIITELVDIASKNGNMLLNVTQRPDGSLDPAAVQLLKEIGAWLNVNGEAIYATRPWTVFGEQSAAATAAANPGLSDRAGRNADAQTAYTARDIRFTHAKEGPALYAIVLGVPPAEVKLKSLAGAKTRAVTLLGSDAKLDWKQEGDALVIQPVAKWPSAHAVAFKIELGNSEP